MAKSKERRESLVYHAKPRPGKIEVVPTKKYNVLKKYGRCRTKKKYTVLKKNIAMGARAGQTAQKRIRRPEKKNIACPR